ncbi:MAG: BamA/TamA family outer membrane protein [Candidatus Lambdaproteobacteria bacterium]|nr:BamA/TamA family outer membrane protein [Candidatus Lambdaproteobacteria bacterium]
MPHLHTPSMPPAPRRPAGMQRAAGPLLAALLCAVASMLPPVTGGAAELRVLPLLLRLEGVGPIVGGAVGYTHVSGERLDLYAGKSFGAVDAAGVVAADVPLGGEQVGLTAFAVAVNEARLDTSYTRGFADDEAVNQRVRGAGAGGIVKFELAQRSWIVNLGLAQSSVRFAGYFQGERRIPLPGAKLFDVNTTALLAGLTYQQLDEPRVPHRGYRLGLNAATAAGRVGQSDTLTLTGTVTGYVPLGDALTWALHGMFSAAAVTRRESKYDTADEVRAALATDCTAGTSDAGQAACERLNEQLAQFIAANNRVGSATPLGGSAYLRGFREMRFRAAQTRALATELRWRVRGRLELTPFYELGYAADDAAALSDESRSSVGLELRLHMAELPVRLGVAQGEERSAWYLMLGYPW